MEKMTNKRIIAALMPILKKALQNIPKLDEKSFYGKPCKNTTIDGYDVYYEKPFENHISVSVTMRFLEGKFDHATVTALIHYFNGGKLTAYSYEKEFRGLGNGFYARLDAQGNIIKSEWD
jgi:hypothetical protein